MNFIIIFTWVELTYKLNQGNEINHDNGYSGLYIYIIKDKFKL